MENGIIINSILMNLESLLTTNKKFGIFKMFSIGCCIVLYNQAIKKSCKFKKNPLFLNLLNHYFKLIMTIHFLTPLIKLPIPSIHCAIKLFMNFLLH